MAVLMSSFVLSKCDVIVMWLTPFAHNPAHHWPVDLNGLRHLLQTISEQGLHHTHPFLVQFLNPDEQVRPDQ